jgi:hypothetical protein
MSERASTGKGCLIAFAGLKSRKESLEWDEPPTSPPGSRRGKSSLRPARRFRIPIAMCQSNTDQRGEPRPEPGGTMCDVGASEVQP